MSVLNLNETLSKPCLCSSGQTYQQCCQPYYLGNMNPETCEQLMRSRYVAYVLQLESYLLSTWAEVNRPVEFEFENGLSWQGLKILKTKKGRKKDKKGWVTFTADYQVGLDKNSMTENSRFIRDKDAHWVYLDGEFI
ncbi:MAG: YchJ family metal-binding protein [Pseudomonadota bacterium]|nr:YchJ family metal-binding protein [Pseudomonadota bacterium]